MTEETLENYKKKKPETGTSTETIEREIPVVKESEQDEFEKMDRMDAHQIKAEIAGKVIEEYVYRFQHGGKTITGLSYSGVMACAKRQGNIKVIDIELRLVGDKYIAKARAKDEKRNLELVAIASQKEKFSSGAEDIFAIQKACSKATRNVIRKLIDEPYAKAVLEEGLKLIEQYKKDSKEFM